ncbi:ChbG/HpnK family deacetylase [Pseudacidovorax intermedius]|uniref:ChbG/HpnK family deacetylase n=1 Tax=Pseudacidovorax intermedius TaxID=433924 RepID=UPI000346BEB2|nr:ChbG/HpnK family deacetylase [Pseudacidovorax intermedius]
MSPPHPVFLRRLCVCADDFGLSQGIDRAILALIDQGVVTATSCMVLRQAWAVDAPWLRARRADLIDVGLHLDLTNVDGTAREASLAGLAARSMLMPRGADHWRPLLRQQLDRFEDAMGRPPSHVDGHRHVHQLPGVRETLAELLNQRYGRALPWLRGTRPGPASGAVAFKQQLIHRLGGPGARRLARRRGIPLSHRLLGVYGFDRDVQTYARSLDEWIAQCQDGDVLMCHPAIGATPYDGIAAARQIEFEALSALSPALVEQGWGVRLSPQPVRAGH